jgi:hypothetical protein
MTCRYPIWFPFGTRFVLALMLMERRSLASAEMVTFMTISWQRFATISPLFRHYEQGRAAAVGYVAEGIGTGYRVNTVIWRD